jgi:hypothetical protein
VTQSSEAMYVVHNERDQPVELYVGTRVVHLGPRERVELTAAALDAPQVRLMLARHLLGVQTLAPTEQPEPSPGEPTSQPPHEAAEPVEEN